MSTSTIAKYRERACDSVLAALAATVTRLRTAFIERRLEAATALLRTLSDEDLSAIGLTREDIRWAAPPAPGLSTLRQSHICSNVHPGAAWKHGEQAGQGRAPCN
jgi:hypothetical protein